MSEMKYLMLFEAFESDALSKMMEFLKGKTDNNSKEMFLNRIKRLMENLDIPIDKIKNENVKYLNRSQALKLRNNEPVDNLKNIYCLKFWFSIEDGFLGFTGVGNETMDFNSYLAGESGRRRRSQNRNEPFDNSDLEYIKNQLNIKTGTLTPVKNYDLQLQHGKEIVGYFSDGDGDKDRLGKGKVWRDGDYLFALQNVASGGNPEDRVNGESYRDWGFNHSWSMNSCDTPGSDHYKLHVYTPGNEPIKVEGKVDQVEELKDVKNPLEFNLPLSSSYRISDWGETSFSIILMIDDILKSNLETVTSVKKSRKSSREGATKLMSDRDIRDANIQRYLKALVAKMGITAKDTNNIQNLQKVLINNLCGDFSLFVISKDRPSLDYISEFTNNLYIMISRESLEDKEYYLTRLSDIYKSLNSDKDDYTKRYTESIDIINKCENKSLVEVFNILMKIGKDIKNYLLTQNIQTIEDLKMIYVKLKSIKSLLGEDEFKLNKGILRNIISDIQNPRDTKYYCDEYKDSDFGDDIKRANLISKYVDSLLK